MLHLKWVICSHLQLLQAWEWAWEWWWWVVMKLWWWSTPPSHFAKWSFFGSFLTHSEVHFWKMEEKWKLKMKWKWPKNDYCEQPYYGYFAYFKFLTGLNLFGPKPRWMSHPIYLCGVCWGSLCLSHPFVASHPFSACGGHGQCGAHCVSISHLTWRTRQVLLVAIYFVIHVTIWTGTTTGLVSGSWNVRASFLLSHCLLLWTVMTHYNLESVFGFSSDHSLWAF